jgi:hypothetical protein
MRADAPPTIGHVRELSQSLPRSRPRLGLGTLVVVALAAGVVAWVLMERNQRVPTAASAAPVVEQPHSTGPRLATVDGLSAVSALRGAEVYWAGARPGTAYEVTETSAGHVFVRYLPTARLLGSPRPDFLTIATYPRPSAFADIEAAARRPGALTIEVPGGLAVYDEAVPTSVYVAFRGSMQQIEVYSPSVLEARRLVEDDRVRPVP